MSDFGQERLVDRLLAHIEKTETDERLRELAAGIRNGDASLRDSVGASAYAQALQPGLEGFAGWYEELGDFERAEQAEQCQLAIDDLNRTAGNDPTDLPSGS